MQLGNWGGEEGEGGREGGREGEREGGRERGREREGRVRYILWDKNYHYS